MSKSLNSVQLLGNVGKDPDIRSAGTVIANFSIATSERMKDSNGDWSDRTEWHGVVAFARLAEVVRDYVRKGSKVFIQGRLQTRSWDDKETGKKVYRTEIVANEVILLDRKEESATQPPYKPYDYPSKSSLSNPVTQEEEEEIPF